MSRRYRPGDQVAHLGNLPGDPYILQFQYYATIVEEADPPEGAPPGERWYIIELTNTHPPNGHFGPFPSSRLAPGWRDENGRWRIK